MSFPDPSVRLLTELDHIRISNLHHRPGSSPDLDADIQNLIQNAELISSYDVPPNVVTMYSQILIADGQTGEQRKLTLCYPHDANPGAGFISVLSPMGSALLGLSAGQIGYWRTPVGGSAFAEIVEILFQPEESGDYLS